MIVLMSLPQLAVTMRSTDYFLEVCAPGKVRSMFRLDGPNVSVGLAYSEDGQNFIARELIDHTASDDEIDAACVRILFSLLKSYKQVMGHHLNWGIDASP